MDQEIIKAIRESKLKLNWFYPVLIAHDGSIIDGHHRLAAYPEWKTMNLPDIDTEEKKVLARIACNFVRREVPVAEKVELLSALAKMGWDVKKISEETGLHVNTIYKYIPGEFKQPEKVKAGEASAQAKSVTRRVTETKPSRVVSAPSIHVPRQSDNRKSAYTDAEMSLINHLGKAKVVFKTQQGYVRPGEFNSEGKPKSYIIDVLTNEDHLGLEVEGAGTSSDNEVRDQFFRDRGITIVHLPNTMVLDYGDVVATLVSLITKQD